jgi:hypothetical protein
MADTSFTRQWQGTYDGLKRQQSQSQAVIEYLRSIDPSLLTDAERIQLDAAKLNLIDAEVKLLNLEGAADKQLVLQLDWIDRRLRVANELSVTEVRRLTNDRDTLLRAQADLTALARTWSLPELGHEELVGTQIYSNNGTVRRNGADGGWGSVLFIGGEIKDFIVQLVTGANGEVGDISGWTNQLDPRVLYELCKANYDAVGQFASNLLPGPFKYKYPANELAQKLLEMATEKSFDLAGGACKVFLKKQDLFDQLGTLTGETVDVGFYAALPDTLQFTFTFDLAARIAAEAAAEAAIMQASIDDPASSGATLAAIGEQAYAETQVAFAADRQGTWDAVLLERAIADSQITTFSDGSAETTTRNVSGGLFHETGVTTDSAGNERVRVETTYTSVAGEANFEQFVTTGGDRVEFGFDADGNVVALRVHQLDGAAVDVTRGEALARDLQVHGITTEMIVTSSPWVHGLLSPENPGLSPAEMPSAAPLMPPAILVEGLLSGDTDIVDEFSDALIPVPNPATPQQVMPDAETALGSILDYWVVDFAGTSSTIASSDLGRSGFGAGDSLTPISVIQVGDSGSPSFSPGPDPVLTYTGPLPPVVQQINIQPAEVPQDFSFIHLTPTLKPGLDFFVIDINGGGWVDDFGNTVARSDLNNAPIGFVGHDGVFDGVLNSATDFDVTPFTDPAIGDFWTSPFPGDFGFTTFAPIVLDLDGNGFSDLRSIASSTAHFDIDGDGSRNVVGWVGPNDGLLVYDHDKNGIVARADEISFTQYKPGAVSDLDGLRAFDTNANGVLDAGDALFGSFGVWRDANQDGISQAGELRTLSEAQVASIGLSATGPEQIVNGATIHGLTTYTTSSGAVRSAAVPAMR